MIVSIGHRAPLIRAHKVRIECRVTATVWGQETLSKFLGNFVRRDFVGLNYTFPWFPLLQSCWNLRFHGCNLRLMGIRAVSLRRLRKSAIPVLTFPLKNVDASAPAFIPESPSFSIFL